MAPTQNGSLSHGTFWLFYITNFSKNKTKQNEEHRFQVSNRVNVLRTRRPIAASVAAEMWLPSAAVRWRGQTIRKRHSFLFPPTAASSSFSPTSPPAPHHLPSSPRPLPLPSRPPQSRVCRALARAASHSRQRQNSVGMKTPNATRMGNIRLLLSAAYGFGVRGPDGTLDLDPAGTFFFPPSSPPSLSSSSSSSSSGLSRPG